MVAPDRRAHLRLPVHRVRRRHASLERLALQRGDDVLDAGADVYSVHVFVQRKVAADAGVVLCHTSTLFSMCAVRRTVR